MIYVLLYEFWEESYWGRKIKRLQSVLKKKKKLIIKESYY